MTKKPDWITENADGSVSIDFTGMPVNVDGTDVTSLTMREPTVQDQLAVDAISQKSGAGEAEVALFGNLLELSPEVVRGLTLRRYSRLQTAFGFFTD